LRAGNQLHQWVIKEVTGCRWSTLAKQAVHRSTQKGTTKMIEWELAWNLTDKEAEALQREIMAMIVLLHRRKSHTCNKNLRLIAMVEVLAFVIAASTCRDDDEQAMEELLDGLTYNMKRSVRNIRASDAAEKLIARLQAKPKQR
jgi:hypothetical protein